MLTLLWELRPPVYIVAPRHNTYVDGVFSIWPHEYVALNDFLGHLKSRVPQHHVFHGTGKGSSATFYVCSGQPTSEQLTRARRLQESHPRRQILQAALSDPLALKRSVITTLMDRAKNICDETTLSSELQHFTFVVRVLSAG